VEAAVIASPGTVSTVSTMGTVPGIGTVDEPAPGPREVVVPAAALRRFQAGQGRKIQVLPQPLPRHPTAATGIARTRRDTRCDRRPHAGPPSHRT
jgi:hypothetical protein